MRETQDFCYDNLKGTTHVRFGGVERVFDGSPAGLCWRVLIDGVCVHLKH